MPTPFAKYRAQWSLDDNLSPFIGSFPFDCDVCDWKYNIAKTKSSLISIYDNDVYNELTPTPHSDRGRHRKVISVQRPTATKRIT